MDSCSFIFGQKKRAQNAGSILDSSLGSSVSITLAYTVSAVVSA